MPIYPQRYRDYDGPRRGRLARWWMFVRADLGRTIRQRSVFWIALVVGLLFGARLIQMYLVSESNLKGLISGLTAVARYEHHAMVSERTYLGFLTNMQFYVFALAAVVGGRMISRDKASGALPLYFSRPLSRWGYISARFIQLSTALSLVSVVPGLLLYVGYSLVTADWEHIVRDRGIVLGIVLDSGVLIVSAGLPILALSCVASNAWTAGAAFAMMYLFGWMIYGFFAAAPWIGGGGAWDSFQNVCNLLSLRHNWGQLAAVLFNQSTLPLDTHWGWSLFALGVLCLLSLLVLWFRLRPVEVVR